ncbi:pilus assembly protein TadG-related protein, partial [Acinetobacter baumannii]
SFEIGRVMLGRQQLQNASDAAALTAVAQLASADNTSPTQAHQDAMTAALTVFQKNCVLGQYLTNSSLVTTQGPVAEGQAKLYFE